MKDMIIFLDDQGNPCPKEEATQARILTTDDKGHRLEVYGIIEPGAKKEKADGDL
jgi:hypothetical protein